MKCAFLLVAVVIFAFVADSEAWFLGSRSRSIRTWRTRYSFPSRRRSFSTWRSRFTPSRSRIRFSSSSRSRSSSSGGSRSTFPHDMKSKSGLTNLYNSRVVNVEEFERPLHGFLGKLGVKHNGVVATTRDGGRWLIHKGSKYGKASDTVVVNAKHMSDQWRSAGGKSARPGTTIGGLVKAGLADKKYNLRNAKCWDATKGMMKKAGRRKRAVC